MAALTIAWEYLTGYAVATDPASRERAEWPPHPARVFMAMAAAWFETAPNGNVGDTAPGDHAHEGDALRWLESLEEPQLWLPPAGTVSERSLVTVYVPVNDRAGPASATLQSVPALTRSRQPRTFPRHYVGRTPCALHWPVAPRCEDHRAALRRLCGRVTRIGHSFSLVQMWMADPQEESALDTLERWEPAATFPTAHCRRIATGLLDSLPAQTQIPRIEQFAALFWQIEDAERGVDGAKQADDREAKKAANRELKEAKQAYNDAFGETFRKSSAKPPPLQHPTIGLWSGYRPATRDLAPTGAHQSHFDTDLLVLSHVAGPHLPVTAALAAGKAVRDVIMKHCGIQPVPAWVSGHKPDGSPNEDAGGHLAVLPLPFVGHEHADGHMLGMALAFPRAVERQERGRVLGPLLVHPTGEPKEVTLTLGPLGAWTLRKRDWTETRRTLEPETWTAHSRGCRRWASATPVVMDRFPKANRGKPGQRTRWEEEVREIIASACRRIGLPHPIHIDVDTTSWHVGSPRAVTKRRRLRVGYSSHGRHDTGLGDGFPTYPSKGSNAPRPQVHVFLQFAEPVCGPVLLGAGRYRGYGLLKPLEPPR